MNTLFLHSSNGSKNRQRAEKQTRHDSAKERADHGNRRIAPIGPALAGDRENGMRNARTKIASRINGISRGAAERQADAPNEAADEIGTEPRRGSASRYLLRENCANDKDENKCGDDFTEQVREKAANRGPGAEAAKLRRRIGCLLPVRKIVKPDQRGAGNSSEQLRDKVGKKLREVAVANRKADRHRLIEMRIAAPASDGSEHSRHHRKRPARSDHNPSAAFGFGALQKHRSDSAIAKQNQNHRPKKFTKQR